MNTTLSKEERQRDSEERKRAQLSKYGKGLLESEDNNPCLKEHKLSIKCMSENNYKEDLCLVYFENYKACKSFWWSVQMDRRRSKIEPELPPPDERAKIKDDYMNRMRQ